MTGISDKKQYGVFYTPRRVADILSAWAIQSDNDRILEPSFGGCEFLESARARLQHLGLGKRAAENRLFGSDIDKNAFDSLGRFITNPNGHFKQTDFLALSSNSFLPELGGFDVVLANPPYVSHHNMLSKQKKSANKAVENHGFDLDGKASLWAYFVLHSLSFLRLGGRMAWILPSSFLYADYSRAVHDALAARFERCLVVNLHERLFVSDGTEEISIIVFCDGLTLGNAHPKLQVVSASNIGQLGRIVKKWSKEKQPAGDERLVSHVISPPEASKIFEQLSRNVSTKTLGDVFRIQIGLVTGANAVFLLNEESRKDNKLSKRIVTPILSKFRFTSGAIISNKDIEELRDEGERCLLVDTTRVSRLDDATRKYLATISMDRRLTTATFQRRPKRNWHECNDHRIPDAFFPYMQNQGTWIVVNAAAINATNSVHRLYRQPGITDSRIQLAAISLLSTFSQVSAELEGRMYGAGVLKHEPSEAARIQLVMPNADRKDVTATFRLIDRALRRKQPLTARSLADQFLIKHLPREAQARYPALEKALNTLRKKRVPIKKLKDADGS